jgi:hypothetical protein
MKMTTLDYTWERREELIRRDEREEGERIGLERGERIGIARGRAEYRKASKLLRCGVCSSIEELADAGIDAETAIDAYKDFLEDA